MTFKNNANPGSNEKKSNQLSFDKLFEHWIAVAVLIFALSFGIRLFRLDLYSLWYDEANTAYLLQDKPVNKAFAAILGTPGSETLHPLYYFVLSVWMQIASCSEWALRFPSVVFGSCAAITYALLLYQVGGTKAFAFALLLIVSPFLMWYSRDARPYALIMFLSGLQILLYLKLLNNSRSKLLLAGFTVTGIFMIHSGILTIMVLFAELLWSLLYRRNLKQVCMIAIVLILATPLLWHGWRTHFTKSSDRYHNLPKGMNAMRLASILQEFFVGRSLGPTPDEVRRLPMRQAIHEKSIELGAEMFTAISVFTAFVFSCQYLSKKRLLHELNLRAIRTLGFIIVACVVQAALLILATNYRMNARHMAFLFGPLFTLFVLPVAFSKSHIVKVAFIVPLFALWVWSCANVIFAPSYRTDDYRSAAEIIVNDRQRTSRIMALCNPKALQYYGVDKPLIYFREAPDVTCNTLMTCLTDGASPTWLVLSRPWCYPGFRAKELTDYFLVLREEHVPGIDMWLLAFPNTK